MNEAVPDGPGSPVDIIKSVCHVFRDNGILREEMPVVCNQVAENILMCTKSGDESCGWISELELCRIVFPAVSFLYRLLYIVPSSLRKSRRSKNVILRVSD